MKDLVSKPDSKTHGTMVFGNAYLYNCKISPSPESLCPPVSLDRCSVLNFVVIRVHPQVGTCCLHHPLTRSPKARRRLFSFLGVLTLILENERSRFYNPVKENRISSMTPFNVDLVTDWFWRRLWALRGNNG